MTNQDKMTENLPNQASAEKRHKDKQTKFKINALRHQSLSP